jgi:hypothetical protein
MVIMVAYSLLLTSGLVLNATAPQEHAKCNISQVAKRYRPASLSPIPNGFVRFKITAAYGWAKSRGCARNYNGQAAKDGRQINKYWLGPDKGDLVTIYQHNETFQTV